eukprot:scaffold4038_cov18-Tisochrysis_lutea.AAC.1
MLLLGPAHLRLELLLRLIQLPLHDAKLRLHNRNKQQKSEELSRCVRIVQGGSWLTGCTRCKKAAAHRLPCRRFQVLMGSRLAGAKMQQAHRLPYKGLLPEADFHLFLSSHNI